MGCFFLLQFDRILDCFVRRDLNFHQGMTQPLERESETQVIKCLTQEQRGVIVLYFLLVLIKTFLAIDLSGYFLSRISSIMTLFMVVLTFKALCLTFIA